MTIGTGNTNHPKCIRLKNLYRIGIMSANINGNITAICNKLTQCCPPLKIFMLFIIHESYSSENVHTPCCHFRSI